VGSYKLNGKNMPTTKEYPYIPIFWNGTHKNKGSKKDWTAEDVRSIFKATNEQSENKIPFTIDHPTNDLPVIGWTDKSNMRLNDQGETATIECRPTEFSSDILEAIKKTGRKKVSVALRSDDYSIRHIGLVERPAVTNLPEIPFEEESNIVFEMEAEVPLFTDEQEQDGETEDETNPISNLEEDGDMPDEKITPVTNEVPPEFQAQLDAVTAERDAIKLKIEAVEAEKRNLEFSAWLDRDELKGKVTPVLKAKALRLMTSMYGADEYEFSEGEDTLKKTPLEEFKEFVEALPETVKFGIMDMTPDDGQANADAAIEDFNKTRKTN